MISTQWQPIGTAPKDGTKIFIWNKKWEMALLARWETHPDEKIKGWLHTYIPWPHNPGEETYFLGWPEDKEEGNMPTHWCYPPTEKKADD